MPSGSRRHSRVVWCPLLVLLGAGLLSSCSRSRPAIHNVLLISIDTLRADHVSAYGFPRPTTPNIDAVAREGVLFKNVHTPVPMTLPAHVSMLTGTLPPTHGLRDNLQNRLPEGSLTLAEMLKARGFTTGAIVSSFVLDRRFGTSQGETSTPWISLGTAAPTMERTVGTMSMRLAGRSTCRAAAFARGTLTTRGTRRAPS